MPPSASRSIRELGDEAGSGSLAKFVRRKADLGSASTPDQTIVSCSASPKILLYQNSKIEQLRPRSLHNCCLWKDSIASSSSFYLLTSSTLLLAWRKIACSNLHFVIATLLSLQVTTLACWIISTFKDVVKQLRQFYSNDRPDCWTALCSDFWTSLKYIHSPRRMVG